MPNGMNRVTLIGNLGKDAEVVVRGNDFKVSNFSIAISEDFTDKTGNRRERTEWVRIAVTNPNIIKNVIEPGYLRKGDRVLIEGNLRTRKYEEDGRTLYMTEVSVALGGRIMVLNHKNQRTEDGKAELAPSKAELTPETADADVPF